MSHSTTASSTSSQVVFAGANIHEISGCNFQLFNGPVTFIQESKPKKRRVVIEDDDIEWLILNTATHSFLATKSHVEQKIGSTFTMI